VVSFGCTRGELGGGLRRSILFFSLFNQEFQVRGAKFMCIPILLVFMCFCLNWILCGMILVLYAL